MVTNRLTLRAPRPGQLVIHHRSNHPCWMSVVSITGNSGLPSFSVRHSSLGTPIAYKPITRRNTARHLGCRRRGSEESPSGIDGRSKEGNEKMLRITVVESALEDRWILQGRLTKCSVAELISSWRASTVCPSGRRCIVDLDKVTSIDKSGEEALSMIMRDGATVVASGVYTRHLLDELARRAACRIPIDWCNQVFLVRTFPQHRRQQSPGAGESPQTALRRGY
jgi:hypothetical protein